MKELNLETILYLAEKINDNPFTINELLKLKKEIEYLITVRKSGYDGVIHTSIIPIREIAIGYGKNIHSESDQERTLSISFNLIDTEKRKDDKVFVITNTPRYQYHFSINIDGQLMRLSSSDISDGSMLEVQYYII